MTGRTTWAVAVLGAAAALTLAACGGSSGGHPTNLSSLAGQGTGAATGTQSAIATSTLGAPGKPGSKTTAGSHTSAAGGHSSSSAARGGSGGGGGGGGNGGGGNGGGGNGGGGSGGGGGGGGAPSSNCASSDTAGASIKVCPATGLHDGDSVTITGHGFTPDNKGLVKFTCGGNTRCLIYTECYYPSSSAGSYGGNANYCLSNTLSLTTQSDANGDVAQVTLQVSQVIRGKYDCAKVTCIVAVSPPDPNPPTTDDPHVVIKFG